MDDFTRVIRYNSLLLIYQELLSKTQKEILTDYFMFNLSLSEIASNRGVTRAAIEDAIKKGQRKLDEYEGKLGILEKNNKVISLVEQLKEVDEKSKQNELLEEIERIVK